MKLDGGCLCGSVRYSIEAEPLNVGYCHCRLCQRASGAPVVAWAMFPFRNFHYVQGAPAVYASSESYQREFCANCGTQLVFRKRSAPERVDVTLGSLDDPSGLRPQFHIWCESQVDWLRIDDGLPRYDDEGSD